MGHRQEIYKNGQLIEVYDDRVLEGEKLEVIEDIKRHTYDLLKETDWEILRASEGGKQASLDTLTLRDGARNASNSAERSVEACNTLEELDQCQWVAHFKDL